jgi:DNA-binding transcriptional LysR family regulator
MKGPSWDDYAHFAVVARFGGLTRAAEITGASVATLSRRMRALETLLGRRLFVHGREGYALTADGRALAERTTAMVVAAEGIERWGFDRGPTCVRISAGTWTSLDLARNLRRYWSPGDAWMPEFVRCDLNMDLARRVVDIGVRNARPDQPWLAGRRTGRVAFAAYGLGPEVEGWIAPSFDADLTPSGRWIARNHPGRSTAKANDPQLAVELALAGVGRVVLPTFVGDGIGPLLRLSEPIEELTTEEWLVAHHEARHDPPIRAALDALGAWLETRGERAAA